VGSTLLSSPLSISLHESVLRLSTTLLAMMFQRARQIEQRRPGCRSQDVGCKQVGCQVSSCVLNPGERTPAHFPAGHTVAARLYATAWMGCQKTAASSGGRGGGRGQCDVIAGLSATSHPPTPRPQGACSWGSSTRRTGSRPTNVEGRSQVHRSKEGGVGRWHSQLGRGTKIPEIPPEIQYQALGEPFKNLEKGRREATG